MIATLLCEMAVLSGCGIAESTPETSELDGAPPEEEQSEEGGPVDGGPEEGGDGDAAADEELEDPSEDAVDPDAAVIEHLTSKQWALIGFEDPITIGIWADADAGLLGRARLVDLAESDVHSVRVEGRQVSFVVGRFFGEGGGHQFHGWISEDGLRMAGVQIYSPDDVPVEDGQWPTSVAWIPEGNCEYYQQVFCYPPNNLPESVRFDGYGVFTLSSGAGGSSGDGGEFSPGVEYALRVDRARGVSGDLGAFFVSEMAASENLAQPLLVGPVSPSAPGVPIELLIHRDPDVPEVLTRVIARTVDHEYEFLPIE